MQLHRDDELPPDLLDIFHDSANPSKRKVEVIAICTTTITPEKSA
jgi:hypothetical protein